MYGSPPPLAAASVGSTHNPAALAQRPSESRVGTLLLHLSLWTLIVAYALVCPYTKVEESFNIQATRDVMKLGAGRHSLRAYDHKTFPGVVPRTFLGPLVLSAVAGVVGRALRAMRLDDMGGLVSVRVSLGIVGAGALSYFLTGLGQALGSFAQQCTAALLVTQFHYLYYMSRPIPNTFASILCLLVFGLFLRRKNLLGLALLSFAAVTFRHELLILVVVNAAMCSGFKLKNCGPSLKTVLLSTCLSAGLATAVDSYFWGRFVIPEWTVFRFNTSPWYWYLLALSTSTPISVAISMVGVLLRVPGWKMAVPSALYILCFCLVPHKEIRFLFPIYPVFALIAGSFESMLRSRNAALYGAFGGLKFVAQTVLFASTLVRVYISSWNYPGGQVPGKLGELVDRTAPAHIHVCNLAAMTGFTRFAEDSLPDIWQFDRSEDASNFKDTYSHLISETSTVDGFQLLGHIEAFDAVEYYSLEDWVKEARFLRLRLPFHMVIAPKLFVLQNLEEHKFVGEKLDDTAPAAQETAPVASSTLRPQVTQPTATIASVPSQERASVTQPHEPVASEAPVLGQQPSMASPNSDAVTQNDPRDDSVDTTATAESVSVTTSSTPTAADPPTHHDTHSDDDYEDELEEEL